MSRKVRSSLDRGSLVDGRTVSHLTTKDVSSYQLGESLGTPIAISPVTNDPALAADPQKNNNFDFSKVSRAIIHQCRVSVFIHDKFTKFTQPTDQSFCPFAAHIRKTNPRSDLGAINVAPHAINRNGIPFGPEVTQSEHTHNKTENERGLAFVCYQSTLAQGFEFMQMCTSILVLKYNILSPD